MKIGIIGAGTVSAATVSFLVRAGGTDPEIVIVNRDRKKADGLAEDFGYAAAVESLASVRAGDYDDLDRSAVVVITAGVNEKKGGATDRSDPRGRRVLIPVNAKMYAEIVPACVSAAPHAALLVVTDPPDPLADLTRELAPNQPVVSAGTAIDSLRFRHYIARELGLHARDVSANVIGEHGTSSVSLWSTATVGGARVLDLFKRRGDDVEKTKERIHTAVEFGNISIIEGIGASQHGIGAVTARLAEAIANDQKTVFPVGSYQEDYQVTLGLPSVLGATGVLRTVVPELTAEEQAGLEASAAVLREASSVAMDAARPAA